MKAIFLTDLHFGTVPDFYKIKKQVLLEQQGSGINNVKLQEIIMQRANESAQRFMLAKEQNIMQLDSSVDCVIICGDLAVPDSEYSLHRRLFRVLKQRFSCPVAFVVGNHDLWVKPRFVLDLLYIDYAELARQEGVVYLEHDNLQIENWCIAGTYGHYDFSFGLPVAITDVNDCRFMNFGNLSDEDLCSALVSGLEQRIQGQEKLITVSHTVPLPNLIGHPRSAMQDRLTPFAGTVRLAETIERYPVYYHFCGHTHHYADYIIGRARVVNIGPDYDSFRYALLDTEQDDVQVHHGFKLPQIS